MWPRCVRVLVRFIWQIVFCRKVVIVTVCGFVVAVRYSLDPRAFKHSLPNIYCHLVYKCVRG